MPQNKILRFFTNAVFLFIAFGCLLIVIGQGSLLNQFISIIPKDSPINQIIKSIGASLIGSGVFTAIIKSSEYTKIFSDVIGEIIWSKKYIEQRQDKKEIWSMVSKLIYDEKFPLISNEIEEIITTHYFPTTHNFYIENQELVMNITDYDENFWKQEETQTITVKPIDKEELIQYRFGGNIDLPDTEIEDLTNYTIKLISVNGKDIGDLSPTCNEKKDNLYHYDYAIPLQGFEHYDIVIERCKIVCKKTNPDKRNFAPYIIKNAKVTVITKIAENPTFYRMGTIKDFTQSSTQTNNETKMTTWTYKGLILPQQGFIIILK